MRKKTKPRPKPLEPSNVKMYSTKDDSIYKVLLFIVAQMILFSIVYSLGTIHGTIVHTNLVNKCQEKALGKIQLCFGIMDCQEKEFNQKIHYGKFNRCINGIDKKEGDFDDGLL